MAVAEGVSILTRPKLPGVLYQKYSDIHTDYTIVIGQLCRGEKGFKVGTFLSSSFSTLNLFTLLCTEVYRVYREEH